MGDGRRGGARGPGGGGYVLVRSLMSSAMEVWLARELRAACMCGSWDTNCFISPTVLALWRS